MKSIYDIQKLLIKYGTIVYIGDRVSDLEMMESEIKDLHEARLIETIEFQTALMVLRREIRIEKEKRQRNRRER
ncbi:YqgQ family protein [Mesobacillus harenae]|uniref:YqgQ family protein n=1 Tax=Mesobacillus harenae TaxID=2213203 RepID=UPI0015810702|nr:YqgQ family protein [Mesobacillus harenae]